MELIERNIYLDELNGLLQQARQGRGCLLFLSGEAGVGKTTLVNAFAAGLPSSVRVLRGACDPLSTPRPLGPFLDIYLQARGSVDELLQRSASRLELFSALQTELFEHRPTIVIIEDAHWADDASLDVIRYLGRRLERAPILLIVTYRDDETGGAHPLRQTIGDLSTAAAMRRLAVRPLSREGVATLAQGSEFDAGELFELTGGNPFYMKEVLELGEAGLPESVRDAVLARSARLPPESRQVLEACAVVGSPADPAIVRAFGFDDSSLNQCFEIGLLVAQGRDIAFRHELARQAVLSMIDPPRRALLEAKALAALQDAGIQDLARLAHHAEHAGDREAALAFAIGAAERAIALHSHREAAAQYARAFRFSHDLPAEKQANLLSAWSYECYLIGQLDDAIEAAEQAVTVWKRAGNRLKEGDAQRWLSRVYWFAGRNAEAERAGRASLEVLKALPPGRELARAYNNLCQLRMLDYQGEEAIEWGDKAIALAEALGEEETRISALTNVGSARFLTDLERGERELQLSLSLALEHGFEDHAARAYANLACNYIEMFEFQKADRFLFDGIAFSTDHDHDNHRVYLEAWQAALLAYRGAWTDAARLAESLLLLPRLPALAKIRALVALGRVQARRGDPSARATLDEALDLALPTGEIQRLGPVRAARAEYAFFLGDEAAMLQEASALADEAERCGHQWLLGEIDFWRSKANAPLSPSARRFEPFAIQIAGRYREAAARWRAIGCPWETAFALAQSDDTADMRFALSEFQKLGAGPAIAFVTERLSNQAKAQSPPAVRPGFQRSLRPETRYARSGDLNIAYQVVGDGPIDLLFVMGWVSNLEYFWEGPSSAFLQRLASFSRLIIFDKRGTGLSDPVTRLPTIEERMDDVRAVLDAAGSERAALFGISEGAAMCSIFAATFPERTAALIIYGGYARRVWSPDYPWAPTPFERQKFYDAIEKGWGGVVDLDTLAPSVAEDAGFREWWAAYLRRSASPGAALALAKMNTQIDIRAFLPSIRVPVLLLHRTGDLDIDVGGARYMAEHISGAHYIELPGDDHLVFAGDQEAILEAVQDFLTGDHPEIPTDRVLATILAFEIVGAAEAAVRLGSAQWSTVLANHERAIAAALTQFRGELIQTTPGGLLAAFDGPGRATRCALALASSAWQSGLDFRAGLHTGECERTERGLAGIPLQVAAAIMGHARAGQILASGTIRDLVAGSGIEFDDVRTSLPDSLPVDMRVFEVANDLPGALFEPSASILKPESSSKRAAVLSRREEEIAQHVASGLSNRQIADELSISPATVERHVSNIFNKLGYHSRAQIAAWVVEARVRRGDPAS